MVLPLPLADIGSGGTVPEEIKGPQAKWWWGVGITFGLVGVARFVTLDVFGALISGLMAFLVYYLRKDGCKNLPRFIMLFGILCAFDAFFELLPLLQSVGGRVSRKIEPQAMEPDGSKQTFSITLETHPFFEKKMGWMYNVQSAAMIASPLAFLWGACLARSAYDILEQEAEDSQPFGAMAAPGGGAAGAVGLPMYNTDRGAQPFSGHGHRLGTN